MASTQQATQQSSTKNAGKTPAGKPAAADPATAWALGDEAPEGFTQVDLPDLDGWFTPEKFPNGIVAGKIEGAFPIKVHDDDMGVTITRDNILVRLMRPCGAIMNEQPIELQPGQVIAVGIRRALVELLDYVEHKGLVWIKPLKKTKLSKGRTLWKFEVRAKGTKGEYTRRKLRPTQEITNDGDVDAATEAEPWDNAPIS